LYPAQKIFSESANNLNNNNLQLNNNIYNNLKQNFSSPKHYYEDFNSQSGHLK